MASLTASDNKEPIEVSKATRIEVVDSLRGFAVYGILFSHCFYLFFLGEPTNTNAADEGLSIFTNLFVNNKFYTLFSLLFGLSFSLMLTRTTDSKPRFYRRFIWRLIILFIIGMVHQLHWNDDILSIYAALGLLLLLINMLNDKMVIVLAAVLLLNLPSYLINLTKPQLTRQEQEAKSQQQMQEYFNFTNAMKEGSYLDTVRMNINSIDYKLDYYLYSGRFSFMLGFFCLGLLIGRHKLFQQFNEKKTLFKKIFLWTGIIAAVLTIIAFIVDINGNITNAFWSTYYSPLMKWQSNVLTITYAAGMALFFSKANAQWIAKQFGYIGKMALTNYVLHSVLGTIFLCGYAFGLLNYSIPVSLAIAASIPLFIIMISFSRWWLSKFKFGPLEWVWRSAIELKALPIKRGKPNSDTEG